jgi:hypothetical protein
VSHEQAPDTDGVLPIIALEIEPGNYQKKNGKI